MDAATKCDSRVVRERNDRKKAMSGKCPSTNVWARRVQLHAEMSKRSSEARWRDHHNHCILFLFLASSGSSSSVRSAVSAGLSSECTFDAILDRLVGGPGVSMPLNGYLAPGSVHPLSGFRVDGVLSFVSGGVPWRLDCCRLGPRGNW
jgi:hypothetical protein